MRRRRSKNAESTDRKRSSGPGWMEESFRALGKPLRRSLPWVLLGGVLLAGVAFGADRMRRDVSARWRTQIEPVTLAYTETQQIGRRRLDLTVTPAGLEGTLSALDPDVAATIAEAYARDPWVERVESVNVTYPNEVRARLTLRRPVAFVRIGATYYWVDRTGLRLPGEFPGAPPSETGLLVIRGARGPVPPPGQAWDDPGVAAGAETAIVLAREAQALGVLAVDVANVNGRMDHRLSELVLQTDKGTRVLWGRPPSSTRPGELAPDDKLRHLRTAAAQGLLLPDAAVDIRFPDRIVHRGPAEP